MEPVVNSEKFRTISFSKAGINGSNFSQLPVFRWPTYLHTALRDLGLGGACNMRRGGRWVLLGGSEDPVLDGPASREKGSKGGPYITAGVP